MEKIYKIFLGIRIDPPVHMCWDFLWLALYSPQCWASPDLFAADHCRAETSRLLSQCLEMLNGNSMGYMVIDWPSKAFRFS